jgi:hypothetical protein
LDSRGTLMGPTFFRGAAAGMSKWYARQGR